MADTNATWEAEPEKAITSLPPRIRDDYYYAAEPGERLDGRTFDWAWDSDSAGISWTKAAATGRASRRGDVIPYSTWQLVPDELPAMEFTPIRLGKVVRANGVGSQLNVPMGQMNIAPHSTASILVDNSELTTAYPSLIVTGGAGSTIRLTYAEALFDSTGQKGNRNEIAGKHIEGLSDEFLPGGGSHCEFMPLAWRTWRYLQLDVRTGDQPLEIEKLQAWFTAFPFVQRAEFQSDDQTLSRIWDVGWRTARLDAHDTYMDTPYWERLQYVGDTRIQALISYTVAGDDRLARQAIQSFNDSRIPEGITQSRYPSSLEQIIPTFSLLWVGMVHDFWIYRADSDFVRAQMPGIRTVLDWFLSQQRPDGLLKHIPWWPFVDWGKDFDFGMAPEDADGGSSVLTLQFIEALRNAAELEETYGDGSIAQRYRAAAAKAADAIRKLCWNQHYGLLADSPAQKHFSQHANILGVLLDVVPADLQKSVLTKILSTTDGGFVANSPVPPMTAATYYFRFYLARALQHAGMGDKYLDLLGPWQKMLSLGLSTWAENPEPTRSDSHAWSAHPNYDLLTLVAGIQPQKPGFESVLIEPHLGHLQKLEAGMPTPKGPIQVQFTRAATGGRAIVNLPAGMQGDFLWRGRKYPLRSSKQELDLP
jgi:hypothetical protein